MPRKTDIRSQRTKGDIKRALLAVLKSKPLADVSIAEVAREAGISRTTFYTHYDCLASVYDELVLDFQDDIQTLHEHLDCVTCRNSQDLVPLCEKARHPGDFEAVLADPRFMSTWFHVSKGTAMKEYEQALVGSGLSPHQAQAVVTFQLSGCMATARSHLGKLEDWGDIQRTLDAFIAGGLAAIKGSAEKAADAQENPEGEPAKEPA